MEGLSRASSDASWIIEGITKLVPFAGSSSTIRNILAPVMIMFSAICDCYLILTSSVEPFNNQTYATQVAFNFTMIDKLLHLIETRLFYSIYFYSFNWFHLFLFIYLIPFILIHLFPFVN
ncbi:MAG: hypothetical protein Ta2E_00960 [Mycoplasmoidaceae bacterium]|nr:MAG: hypothetical protein Ta2E_00960 [Mycoplasmoidaceae bacterium]